MRDPLAALKARFRARAAANVERIEDLWATDRGSGELRGVIHDLAGAAGIFGHPRLGEAAMEIDDRYAAGDQPDEVQIEILLLRLREAAG